MPHIPPTAWAIGALAVLYVTVRIWATRAEERRRAAHEERMEKLYAEREAAERAAEARAAEEREAAGAPSSLAAVTSDSDPEPAAKVAPVAQVKIRCRACKALNDESATACAECGAEL